LVSVEWVPLIACVALTDAFVTQRALLVLAGSGNMRTKCLLFPTSALAGENMKLGETTSTKNTLALEKASYRKPALVALGDLRALTQSGSTGAKEGSSGGTTGMMG